MQIHKYPKTKSKKNNQVLARCLLIEIVKFKEAIGITGDTEYAITTSRGTGGKK